MKGTSIEVLEAGRIYEYARVAEITRLTPCWSDGTDWERFGRLHALRRTMQCDRISDAMIWIMP